LTSDAPSRDPLIGKTLGHYRILEKIGVGGMGEVYRAQDEHLERTVAIKVLPPGTLSDDSIRKRFRKEALALSKLNHPNIATIHDFDTQQGVDFLVMEYIPGITLGEKLASRSLHEKELLTLAIQLAEGLSAAHEHGVVHRDLKPSNLRLTSDGRLKILDFGLAKLFDPARSGMNAETLTQSMDDPQIVGTLPYMAPEQVSNEDVDARTDIYALGVVLYEMATQQRPFHGDSISRLFASILNENAVAPRVMNPRLSPELERIILKCLEKDPSRRFQSAKEIAVDLDRCEHPTEARLPRPAPASLWRRVSSPARTHPFAFTFSGLSLAMFLLLLWWTLGARPALPFSPRDFVMISDFDNQTGEAVFDRSLLTALSVSVEQSAHVNVVPPERLSESLKRMGKNPGDRIDEATGRQICLRESVRALLVPSISRVGQQYILSARLINPQTGASAWSDIETAHGQNEILSALGKLATHVRRGLGESWFATWKKDRPLPLVTTPSLSALKMYADGQDLWNKGKYHQAMQLWQLALQADPDFAMAHVAVGAALYSYIYNDPVGGKKEYERALQPSGRITERERLYVRAMYAVSQNHFADAQQLLQAYLQEYPDDGGARYDLAHLLRDNDRCPEAIEEYKQVLRLYFYPAGSMIDIATCDVRLKNFPEALQYYEQAFKLEPSWNNGGNLTREYGLALVWAGQEAKARELYTANLANPDTRSLTLRSLAYLDLYDGHYRSAEAHLKEALLLNQSDRAPLSALRNHCILGTVYEGLGDYRSWIRELDAASQLYPSIPDKVNSGLWLVRGYARAHQPDKAAAVLNIMKNQADMNDASQASEVNFSEAEVNRQRGDYARAIKLLLLADHQHRTPYVLDGLSRAYEAAGDTEQAAHWLKTFNDDQLALGYEPQQDWLASFVTLARIDLAQGKKDEAKALLAQFLTLWKGADSEIPFLKQAKTEYANLH
jgi:serine/threonine protein kinase/tetratricopeptide (TPR) repeat protein